MDRRLFFVASMLVASSVPGRCAWLTIGERVRLISYPDSRHIGEQFEVVGKKDNPPVMNEHYRLGRQIWSVCAGGVHLDVYEDEIVPV